MIETPAVDARGLAASVLLRVWDDDAFAAAALSSLLDESRLESRDRGLATELVYGVLRTRPYLLRRVQAFGQPKEDDSFVLAHLLLAAYQIEFLDRVPARAAVHEAVTAVSGARGRRVGGFVNAVLRRVSEVDASRRASLADAIMESTPSWLRKKLERCIGQEATRLLLSDVRESVPSLRLARGHDEPAWFAAETELIPLCPRAYRYRGGGDPRRHAEFRAGAFVVQELGAQMIARALGVLPGESVLDVCAGRGQKTAILAEQAGERGRVVATDVHPHKLSSLTADLDARGHQVETLPWDWTEEPPAPFHAAFDRVLVDAPCTGVGTLRRRPEILQRLTPGDPARLRDLQIRILRNAARALKPEGTLIYATCSVLEAEAEEVLAGVLDLLEPRPFGPSEVVLAFPERAGSARLLPHQLGTDGYFVARLAHGAAGK